MELNDSDRKMLDNRGITAAELERQLKCFATGFPYLKLVDSARPGKGITVLSADEQAAAVDRWRQYLADGGDVCKFVPASGAASRMFKALFSFVDGEDMHPAAGSPVAEVVENIHKMAFYPELNSVVMQRFGADVDTLLAQGREKDVIGSIILPEGLNYGNLPKGLLTFHRAAGETTRTPLEEQIVEGAQSACQADGKVNLHLTV